MRKEKIMPTLICQLKSLAELLLNQLIPCDLQRGMDSAQRKLTDIVSTYKISGNQRVFCFAYKLADQMIERSSQPLKFLLTTEVQFEELSQDQMMFRSV